MASVLCCFLGLKSNRRQCVCEALLEPNLFLSQPVLSFLAAFLWSLRAPIGNYIASSRRGLWDYPPPAAHTAVPIGHLWNASTSWKEQKVVLSPNCRVSWQPRGFEAPPAHSSGLGPLVPPEFPAETLVNHTFPTLSPTSRGNHLARCKAASSDAEVVWAL